MLLMSRSPRRWRFVAVLLLGAAVAGPPVVPLPIPREETTAPATRRAPHDRPAPCGVAASPVPPAAAAAPVPPVGPGLRLYHVAPGPAPWRSEGTPEGRARAFLAMHGRRLGMDRMPGTLVLRRAFASPVGEHVRFTQVVDGVPVFGSEVSVHFAPGGSLLAANADVFPAPERAPDPAVPAGEARATAALEAGGGAAGPVETEEPTLCWLPSGKTSVLAWRAEARSEAESLRVFVDALDGEVLETQDLRHAADGEGQVFVPNPVWSRRDRFLDDIGDADSAALSGELVTVPLRRLDGSGYLRGAWADLTPTRSPAHDPGLSFLYTRSDERFEQVNAYWHIDAVQDRLRTMLGFPDVLARPQKADAHAGPQDNSYFDEYNGRLYFGDGAVDDGEDGDVVVHEYGHALQEDMVEGFGLSWEAAAMGEGFGDWIAVSRRSSGSGAWDDAFASWDAIPWSSSNPPALRRTDSAKVFPDDLQGEVHEDGEIWSSALREIREALGEVDGDRVILGHHLLLTARATFVDAAAALVATDLSLRGGAGEDAIRAAFASRGIAVGDDALEPDDGPAAASFVDRSSWEALHLADEDWFRFVAESGTTVTARLSPYEPAARPSLALFAEDLSPLGADAATYPTGEVATPAGSGRRTFLLRIAPRSGIRTPYDLRFTGGLVAAAADPFEPNDSQGTAARLPTGADLDLRLAAGNDDWFLLPGTSGGRVRALASFDGAAVDLDLEFVDPDGGVLASSAGTGSSESVDWTSPAGGPAEVFLRVRADFGSGPYSLAAFVDPPEAASLRGRLLGTLAAGGERDYGVDVRVPPGGTALLRVTAVRAGRDGAAPEVEVLSPGGFLLSPFGAGFDGRRTVLEIPTPEDGVHRIRVRPAPPSEGAFRLRARVR